MSYYQMHRGWMDNPAFGNDPYSRAQAWCWLIENAAWKETRVPVEGGILTLKRGQLAYSLRYLAKAWRWKSDRRVRVFLARLRVDEMVQTLSAPKTDAGTDAGRTVLTICNYEKYQVPAKTTDAPEDAVRTQQGRKEEEVKEDNSRRDGRTVKAIIFGEGKAWLAEKTGKPQQSFGGLINRSLKAHGEDAVLLALVAAQKEDAIDPVAWIEGRFRSQAKEGGFNAPPSWGDKYRNGGERPRKYDPHFMPPGGA